jgi:hypothetical protein
MAVAKPPKTPQTTSASAKGASKSTRDALREMLSDVNETLHAIGDVIENMPTHGDLHDDHVELAKTAKKLAKETHAKVKAALAEARNAKSDP